MKNRKTIAMLIFLATCHFALKAEIKINIKKAADKNLISLSAVAKGGNTGKCVTLYIKNKTNKKLKIVLDAGRLLINSNKAQQDLVITEQNLIFVEPNQQIQKDIYAMCGEANDVSPKKNVKFNFGLNNRKDIKELALIIYKNKFQNTAGQKAIWCLTDNHLITDIKSKDTFETNTLRRFIAKTKKIEYKPEKLFQHKKSTQLYVGFNLISAKKVTIYITSKNGDFKKYYQQNYPYLQGSHSTKVLFETDDAIIKDYDLVVETDNEIVMKRSFKL